MCSERCTWLRAAPPSGTWIQPRSGYWAFRRTASWPAWRPCALRLPTRPRPTPSTAFQVLLDPGNSGRLQVRPHAPPVFIAGGYLDRPDITQGMAQLYLKYQ
jgi:hypothetical protein